MAKMVGQSAAGLGLHGEQKYAINEDHSNMVKFSSSKTRSYETVVRCVLEILCK